MRGTRFFVVGVLVLGALAVCYEYARWPAWTPWEQVDTSNIQESPYGTLWRMRLVDSFGKQTGLCQIRVSGEGKLLGIKSEAFHIAALSCTMRIWHQPPPGVPPPPFLKPYRPGKIYLPSA